MAASVSQRIPVFVLMMVLTFTFVDQGESAPQYFMNWGRHADVLLKQGSETVQNAFSTITGVTEAPSKKVAREFVHLVEDPNFTIDKYDDMSTLSEKGKYFWSMYPVAFGFACVGVLLIFTGCFCCCCCCFQCCKPKKKRVPMTVVVQEPKTLEETVPMMSTEPSGATRVYPTLV